MARFPVVTSRDVVRVLTKLGFVLSRQAGSSHAIYRRPSDNRRTVVPIHARKTLKRRTLAAILRDAEIEADEFRRLSRE
jgi:predicted RNA binding protein YcfA (HicA-like mRNA interferase family)